MTETKPAPTKRGRGRPPYKKTLTPREPQATQQAAPQPKAKPDYKKKFGTVTPDWNANAFASLDEDRLGIARDKIEQLEREGIAIQWMTESVLGQPQEHAMAVHRRNGWMDIQPGEIPGVDIVQVEGMRLMARPMAIHRKAQARDKQEAEGRIQTMRESHNRGLPIKGGDHSSVRNYHKKTVEALEIPRDKD